MATIRTMHAGMGQSGLEAGTQSPVGNGCSNQSCKDSERLKVGGKERLGHQKVVWHVLAALSSEEVRGEPSGSKRWLADWSILWLLERLPSPAGAAVLAVGCFRTVQSGEGSLKGHFHFTQLQGIPKRTRAKGSCRR